MNFTESEINFKLFFLLLNAMKYKDKINMLFWYVLNTTALIKKYT